MALLVVLPQGRLLCGGFSIPHNGKLFRDFSTQWKKSR
jgi:hypothetical protein